MQRDYILRIIEQLGQLLIAIRRRLLAGDVDRDALEHELSRVSTDAGIDLEIARRATADTLLMMVAPTGEVEPGRCWLLAEILAVDGLERELAAARGEALDRYEKALALYRLLEPGGAFLVGLPEAAERIADLESRRARLSGESPVA